MVQIPRLSCSLLYLCVCCMYISQPTALNELSQFRDSAFNKFKQSSLKMDNHSANKFKFDFVHHQPEPPTSVQSNIKTSLLLHRSTHKSQKILFYYLFWGILLTLLFFKQEWLRRALTQNMRVKGRLRKNSHSLSNPAREEVSLPSENVQFRALENSYYLGNIRATVKTG